MSTISVIIPVFNHARTLKAVLKSIAGQTTRASEIIVVDDGSTDHLSSRVHELQKEFSFNFLQQPNQGAASARNTGFRIAHGEFVIFWDADTIAEPHFLEKLLEALQKTQVSNIIHSLYMVV
jgi:glycosyltransferase involved in cell wall biosynthesis